MFLGRPPVLWLTHTMEKRGISDSGTAVMIGGLGCVVEGAISGQAGNTIYLSVGSNGWAGGSGYAYMKVTFGNGRYVGLIAS